MLSIKGFTAICVCAYDIEVVWGHVFHQVALVTSVASQCLLHYARMVIKECAHKCSLCFDLSASFTMVIKECAHKCSLL